MAHSQAINNNLSSSMPHIQLNTLLESFSNIIQEKYSGSLLLLLLLLLLSPVLC